MRLFSVSTISPFHVKETRNFFFVLLCGNMVQCLRLPKEFEPRKSNLEEWEFLSTLAASWNYRWSRQIRECVSFQSNRSHHSTLLWQILTTYGRTILHLTNCSLEWTMNHPLIAQVAAENLTVKNAKPQIDWHWPKPDSGSQVCQTLKTLSSL